MKRIAIFALFCLSVIGCESDLGFVPPDPDLFVVRGYLFTGEPVTEFTVTSVLSIDADSTETVAPISDAQITLIKAGVRYDLVPTTGEPGRYHYPGSDLTVEVGDFFQMEATHAGTTATAETVVPAPPLGLELSADSLIAPEGGIGGPGRGGQGALQNRVVARWANPGGELHYVVVDNMEVDPVILPTTEIFSRFAPRIIQQPTASDSAFVAVLTLTHFGNHRLRLYRINDEYADLYEGLEQDSRDLNEPPTNIRGGLGVFAAFSADSAFFEVR